MHMSKSYTKYSPWFGTRRPRRRREAPCRVYDLKTGAFKRIEKPRPLPTPHERRMKKHLDRLLPGVEHHNNYRPDWLRNPLTGRRLELDRYYPTLGIAFEYQGPHHYIPSFDENNQMYRDRVKKDQAENRGVVIVYIYHQINQYQAIEKRLKQALRRRKQLLEALQKVQ